MMTGVNDQVNTSRVLGEYALKPENYWVVTFRMFLGNKAAVIGAIVLVMIILIGIFGPIIFPADPFQIVGAPLTEPGQIKIMGTDYIGRDIFIGIIYGTRPTLAIAFAATFITIILGLTVGSLAGFHGGKIDNALMRLTEFFQVLPSLVLAMVIIAVFTTSVVTVVISISITFWTGLARLTRAEFLKIKEREFVLANHALGARNSRIILRVILPNALPPLIVTMTLLIGICIIFEAALSFLGLNDPDVMTWGMMIGLSRDFFMQAWWTVTFPGLAILITVLSIALVGDGLNDALNPKLRER